MTTEAVRAAPPALGSAELTGVLEEIAGDARRRLDQGGGRPDRALQLVREHRIGAVRIPSEAGGGGYTLREFFQLAIGLAEADPDVPHILRTHFGTVEEAWRTRDTPHSRQNLDLILAGKIFSGAQAEQTVPPGTYNYDTVLRVDGENYRLNGRKLYTTGSLYADYLSIAANDERGEHIGALIPGDREGVIHVDDWDGIGQRQTGSGTTVLDNVLVLASEVRPFRRFGAGAGRPRGAQAHLLLHAIGAGILRALSTQTAQLLRSRSRAYSRGNAELARNDPQLLAVVGAVSSAAYVVEAAVLAAADSLELASNHVRQHGTADDELEFAASLAAAKVKVAVEEIALRAAGEAFNAGGASWTRESVHLDRHWRNLRTLFSHNPTVYKARVVGDVIVNDAELPSVFF